MRREHTRSNTRKIHNNFPIIDITSTASLDNESIHEVYLIYFVISVSVWHVWYALTKIVKYYNELLLT